MNESLVIGSLAGVFILVCVLFQGFLISHFHINRFATVLLHAAIFNIGLLAVLYIIWPLIARLDVDEDKVFPLLPILLITTIVVEGVFLKVLNFRQPWSRIFLASSVTNVPSFVIFYGIILLL
jgi:hypothetical protein